MRSTSLLTLALALLAPAHPAKAQDAPASVATLHLADGTSVALLEWKLSYEFATWKKKEPISSARSQVREDNLLILGKKTYPLQGETLSLKRIEEDRDSVRVVSVTLKNAGELKLENPSPDLLAPDLDKGLFLQPRSLDIVGKTLSGIERSFCVASFSALVECGMTSTTRVVKIDFN